jgi:hypothetical protein
VRVPQAYEVSRSDETKKNVRVVLGSMLPAECIKHRVVSVSRNSALACFLLTSVQCFSHSKAKALVHYSSWLLINNAIKL